MRTFIATCQLALLAGLFAFLVMAPADAAPSAKGCASSASNDQEANEGGETTTKASSSNSYGDEVSPKSCKDDSDLSKTKTNQDHPVREQPRQKSGNTTTRITGKVKVTTLKLTIPLQKTNGSNDATTKHSPFNPSSDKPEKSIAQLLDVLKGLTGKLPIHLQETNGGGEATTKPSSSNSHGDKVSHKSSKDDSDLSKTKTNQDHPVREQPRQKSGTTTTRITGKVKVITLKLTIPLQKTNGSNDAITEHSPFNPSSDKPENPIAQLLDVLKGLKGKLPIHLQETNGGEATTKPSSSNSHGDEVSHKSTKHDSDFSTTKTNQEHPVRDETRHKPKKPIAQIVDQVKGLKEKLPIHLQETNGGDEATTKPSSSTPRSHGVSPKSSNDDSDFSTTNTNQEDPFPEESREMYDNRIARIVEEGEAVEAVEDLRRM